MGRHRARSTEDGTWPQRAAGADQLRGPNLGRLFLMEGGTRIRVIGRAWELFDDTDLIEVTIETTSGHLTQQKISIAQFEVLTASAKVML